MRDPSKELKDMPKRLKKEKSDRIRNVQSESRIKSENDVLNERRAFLKSVDVYLDNKLQ